MDDFLKDESPAAFAKVVDRLLASPHHGERWARYWLDVARYAEDKALAFVNTRPHAYRYRDWVVQALNSDMRYDRFLRLQIAGDLLSDPEPDPFVKLAGLGFQGLGAEYHRGSVTAQVIADELDDRIDTLTRGLLGLTVACARCHDHKYDPIPTRDYYSLAAAYNGSNLDVRPLTDAKTVESYRAWEKTVKEAEARFKAAEKERGKGKPTEASQKEYDARKAELDRLRKNRSAPFAHGARRHRRRHGDARLQGGQRRTRRRPSAASLPPYSQSGRQTDGQVHAPRARRCHRLTPKSADGARHRQSRLALSFRPRHRRHAEQLRATRRSTDASRIARYLGSALHGKRLVAPLAASRDHAVAGVSTQQRQRAGQCREGSGESIPVAAHSARLDFEAWRDTWLAVSGRLDRTVGGPSLDLNKADNVRRTLYAKISRVEPNSLLVLFDFPDANVTSDRRTVTTVPQQQLFVLNSDFTIETAKAFAKRL